MGVIDTEGKKYLSDNEIFADAFNYLVYGGKQVIKAAELREIDTTEFAVPYGNNAKAPVQKYRDILKLWNAMMDDDAIYVILGAELQDKVHYGMPVKDGLYDMLDFKNDAIKSYVPDYKLNLISPADMEDEEFGKFSTDLGFAMEVIKHQSSDADEVIERTNHRKIDRDTALFLNTAVKLNLEYEEETGGVDMCLAMEKKEKKDKIIGVIDYMRDEGKSESDIIDKIIDKYHVTKEYVLALLTPQKA